MTKRTQITENTYTVGHNNVFVDLGFPEEEATELKIKAYLFHYLLLAVKKELRKNTQAQLAKWGSPLFPDTQHRSLLRLPG